MNLSVWEQVLLWAGGTIAYVICVGFAWALLPEDFRKDQTNWPAPHLASVGWPCMLAIYIVYSALMIGPRVIERLRREKLPRAEIRR